MSDTVVTFGEFARRRFEQMELIARPYGPGVISLSDYGKGANPRYCVEFFNDKGGGGTEWEGDDLGEWLEAAARVARERSPERRGIVVEAFTVGEARRG